MAQPAPHRLASASLREVRNGTRGFSYDRAGLRPRALAGVEAVFGADLSTSPVVLTALTQAYEKLSRCGAASAVVPAHGNKAIALEGHRVRSCFPSTSCIS